MDITDVIIYGLLLVTALLCVLPLVNMVAISFSNSSAVNAGQVTFWPVKPTLASYTKMLTESAFIRAFGISAMRSALGPAIEMFFCIMMAYPLSKGTSQFRYRTLFMWILVFSMLFSGGLIPTFINVRNLKLMDTIWALVLPGAVSAFSVILLMNFFRDVPRELDEAASIDGANAWYIAFRIYVPVSLPALATLSLFSIVGHWNDYFAGLIYMNKPESYPLQTYIRALTLPLDFRTMSRDEILERMKVGSQTFSAAKIVVSMVPILCIYPFLQRYFVKGLVLGSVKE